MRTLLHRVARRAHSIGSVYDSQSGRRALMSGTFYDSQSGRHVTVPTQVQCHVAVRTLPDDRVSSALAHLLKGGRPVLGIATVTQPSQVANDEAAVRAVAAAGHPSVCVDIESVPDGVAAIRAARDAGLYATAQLHPSLCGDPHDLQLSSAEVGDAGADAILLSVAATLDHDELREAADMACEIDLVGAPMRSRLGLCIAPGRSDAEALKLVRYAHAELGLLHFAACLAGKQAPRPTELLKATGVKPADMNMSALMLAEHVPDAA
jgi:hypothetical protein